MNKVKRIEILEKLSQVYQGAKIELHYQTPFQLVVAVLLSAQATDIGVNKATKELFEKVKTPQDMIELGAEKLSEHIKTIGLYNAKTKHVMALSHKLMDEFDGEVPDRREALQSLPGVGRKTANVVLNELFGQPTIAVDTHIFRVSNRSRLARGKTPEEVELKLLRSVPSKYKHPLHQWLIQLGRYTCVARKPKCGECPISNLCEYPDKVL